LRNADGAEGIEQRVGGWRSGPAGLEVGGKGQTTDDRRQVAEDRKKSEVRGQKAKSIEHERLKISD